MRWLIVVAMVAATSAPLSAQITEMRVPFDTAGKLRTLTPAVVQRLGLSAPAWPVTGDFTEAALFATSVGGHVISVERRSGAVDRYALNDSTFVALRAAVDAALSRTGSVVTEERVQMISEPAGNAFVRNQMVLGFTVYGGLLAALANDGKTGTALYLLAAGTSYFASTAISRQTTITRAQNHLATDGALRGAGATAGLLYAAVGNIDDKSYAGVTLAGALAGSALGYQFGKRLTDSEAEAATSFSNFAALTVFGLSGATGIAQHSHDDGRTVVGAVVASGLAGYGLGPLYPRRAGYAVTKGDVQILSFGALLGGLVGFTPFANENNADSQAAAGAATAGFVSGIFVADRLAKRFDYSTSDATQVSLGMAAGGLMGAAVASLAESRGEGTLALVTAGGILGAIAGHKFAQPALANSGSMRVGSRSSRRPSVQVDPSALVLGAARVPGRHGIVNVRF